MDFAGDLSSVIRVGMMFAYTRSVPNVEGSEIQGSDIRGTRWG
jgi:hypothetical protein